MQPKVGEIWQYNARKNNVDDFPAHTWLIAEETDSKNGFIVICISKNKYSMAVLRKRVLAVKWDWDNSEQLKKIC